MHDFTGSDRSVSTMRSGFLRLLRFLSVGVSGMDNSEFLLGRSFGGCAIYSLSEVLSFMYFFFRNLF